MNVPRRARGYFAGNFAHRAKISALCLLAILVCIVGCSEDESDRVTGPGGGDNNETKVVFHMTEAADLSVFLDGSFLSILDHVGDSAEKEIEPGDHTYYFHDNLTLFTLDEKDFSILEGATQSIYVIPGSDPWNTMAVIGKIGISDDRDNRRLWFGYSASYYEYVYSEQYLSAVSYFMMACQQSETGYCHVLADCSTNEHSGLLGKVKTEYIERSTSDNTPVWYFGDYYDYSCFPNRSSGATYYAMVRLYLGQNPHYEQMPISREGPPDRIVRIVFDSQGMPRIYD